MTTKRFMVDDAGTLIDMHTRDTFDYVSDVCDLLNEQHETIQRLKIETEELNEDAMSYQTLYEQQKQTIQRLKQNIDELLLVNVEEELLKENEQLKQFIDDLTTKGNGRIDLANGYSYSVSAVLTNWKGDVE